MTWTFYLNVTNDTDRDLELVESQLHWGYWNTGGEEDKEPQSIKAGKRFKLLAPNQLLDQMVMNFLVPGKIKIMNIKHRME